MVSRIFQGIVLQMKENIDRVVGVIDVDGAVVACSELSLVGAQWPEAVEAISNEESPVTIFEGRTFQHLAGWGNQFDYGAFVEGDDQTSAMLCAMAVVAFNGAKTSYEERHDKATFIKSIISDNILVGDIYTQSKELHFVSEIPRVAFLVRQPRLSDAGLVDVIQGMFPDKMNDFVISVNENDVAIIKQISPHLDIEQLAEEIAGVVDKELGVTVIIGIGTVVNHIRDLARSFKEAGVAIDVGKVFDTEKMIINYQHLGIGRIIYQLPTVLCQTYLKEVFKKAPIDALDQETLTTINKFFENNLNVSETARKLFVHRNTLVYRLDKIKKLTGLDLREFDDALTFEVALMVNRYLISRGIEI
ncbi:MAG: helix-turn-helix domain-containing protein [Eubacteriales bacterium]